MLGSVDQLLFCLSGIAPQHKYGRIRTVAYHFDDAVGKSLPTFACMALRSALSDCKDGVEQQHAFVRPARQISAIALRYAKVVFKSLINIDKRRWTLDAFAHRKLIP